MSWDFYGRSRELADLQAILDRNRWFFVRVTGRRRIGKTTLVQQALAARPSRRTFYLQIPDSAQSGVLAAARDAIQTFAVPEELGPWPDSLLSLAQFTGRLARAGWLVVLDEFQFFSRRHLSEFTSYLQSVVDELSAKASDVRGGLIVLGSIHAELLALLENRDAPLYNRTTDQIELKHLDCRAVLEIMAAHTDLSPSRLLMLWNLFEGVPKFYRDAFEQNALGDEHLQLIAKMFFRSSSPLRSEAENWFLSELRGRYDVVLRFVARNPGCSHGEIVAHIREANPDALEQAGSYLKTLIERYALLEKRLPVFAKPTARSGRYYIRDNFLRSWLAALQPAVSAQKFMPEDRLLAQAVQRLQIAEGFGFERLIATLYEERSRSGFSGFSLTQRIEGYWDRKDTEIDLIAIDDDSRIIRFGSCKRSDTKLWSDLPALKGAAVRFLESYPQFRHYRQEYAAHSPEMSTELRKKIEASGVIPIDLVDLTVGLHEPHL